MKIDLLENEKHLLTLALSKLIWYLNGEISVAKENNYHERYLEEVKNMLINARALKKKVQI